MSISTFIAESLVLDVHFEKIKKIVKMEDMYKMENPYDALEDEVMMDAPLADYARPPLPRWLPRSRSSSSQRDTSTETQWDNLTSTTTRIPTIMDPAVDNQNLPPQQPPPPPSRPAEQTPGQ